MSASAYPGLHFRKPKKQGKRIRVKPQRRSRPAAKRKQPSARMKANRAKDRSENALVLERSGGRCEVRFYLSGLDHRVILHCPFKAEHVHHLIGGGRRGKGISALKEHKLAVCQSCHEDIHGGVGGKRLFREGGPVPHWTDTYRRVRKAA